MKEERASGKERERERKEEKKQQSTQAHRYRECIGSCQRWAVGGRGQWGGGRNG